MPNCLNGSLVPAGDDVLLDEYCTHAKLTDFGSAENIQVSNMQAVEVLSDNTFSAVCMCRAAGRV